MKRLFFCCVFIGFAFYLYTMNSTENRQALVENYPVFFINDELKKLKVNDEKKNNSSPEGGHKGVQEGSGGRPKAN